MCKLKGNLTQKDATEDGNAIERENLKQRIIGQTAAKEMMGMTPECAAESSQNMLAESMAEHLIWAFDETALNPSIEMRSSYYAAAVRFIMQDLCDKLRIQRHMSNAQAQEAAQTLLQNIGKELK